MAEHRSAWHGPSVFARSGCLSLLRSQIINADQLSSACGPLHVRCLRRDTSNTKQDSFKLPSRTIALVLTTRVLCFDGFEHKHKDDVVGNPSGTTQNIPGENRFPDETGILINCKIVSPSNLQKPITLRGFPNRNAGRWRNECY